MRGSRRRARILALQSLYEADTSEHAAADVLARHMEEAAVSEETEEYARELIAGVTANREAIDGVIVESAPNWPLVQMSRVDRNILRLAIFEVLYNNTRVPPKAAINEAVELAKSFGSDSSSRFVNGVLGTVVTRIAPQQADSDSEG